MRTDIYRYYNEVKTRNINNPGLLIEPIFTKDFQWTRFYDIKYDITKQLKFDFTASTIARIDEPAGGVDSDRYPDIYDEWRDSVMTSLSQFGQDNKLLPPVQPQLQYSRQQAAAALMGNLQRALQCAGMTGLPEQSFPIH
ncbi:MAG: hypothetical protein MZV63_42745 [Marinilabiliales bacterium]|nr:hypothetical protein [Marinilabiliales bacterium]